MGNISKTGLLLVLSVASAMSQENVVDCCKEKGVDPDCIGLCKTLDPPMERSDHGLLEYPNFCNSFNTEINACWKESKSNILI